MLGEKNILSLSNAMHRAGLEPEGCLRDASWDAYNGARLMETPYFRILRQIWKRQRLPVIRKHPRFRADFRWM